MTREQCRERAIEIIDSTYERAVCDVEQMLEERGISTGEIASILAHMASEHQRLRTSGIDEVFARLAAETVH